MAKKLFFVIPEDWFFRSHFAERAKAAVQAGYEVSLITHINAGTPPIEMADVRVIAWRFKRGSLNPFEALASIWQLCQLYKSEKPDLVYVVALKTILFSAIAARLANLKSIINAPVGLGYVFSANSFKAKMLRPVVRGLLKFMLNPKGSRVIFENPDNMAHLLGLNLLSKADARLIRGAGVDTALFTPAAQKQTDQPPHFICIARMLQEKGIGEFVAAAQIVKARFPDWRFTLVGASDAQNAGAVPLSTLQNWHTEGTVEWLGQRHDIVQLLQSSHVYVLPSYGEGLPKSSLEALACGLPIITTDVPGCRETVLHGQNGLLVAPKQTAALAEAMLSLGQSPEMREAFGIRSRQLALDQFASERIIEQTLAVWAEICPPN